MAPASVVFGCMAGVAAAYVLPEQLSTPATSSSPQVETRIRTEDIELRTARGFLSSRGSVSLGETPEIALPEHSEWDIGDTTESGAIEEESGRFSVRSETFGSHFPHTLPGLQWGFMPAGVTPGADGGFGGSSPDPLSGTEAFSPNTSGASTLGPGVIAGGAGGAGGAPSAFLGGGSGSGGATGSGRRSDAATGSPEPQELPELHDLPNVTTGPSSCADALECSLELAIHGGDAGSPESPGEPGPEGPGEMPILSSLDYSGKPHDEPAGFGDTPGFGNGDPTGPQAAPVPEPATLTLLGLGLAGSAMRRWRKLGAADSR